MTKAQEMLAKAGFPDTKQGRAAFHKMYPTPEHFFKVHGNVFKDFPNMFPIKLPIKPENIILNHSPDRDYYLENTPADSPETDDDSEMYKSGGGIHIKPSHKGRFTAYKKRTGKTTAEALHSKDPHVRQMANFARNAAKWKHEEGGPVMYGDGTKVYSTSNQNTSQVGNNYQNTYQTASTNIDPNGNTSQQFIRQTNNPNQTPYVRYFNDDALGSEMNIAGGNGTNMFFTPDSIMSNFLKTRSNYLSGAMAGEQMKRNGGLIRYADGGPTGGGKEGQFSPAKEYYKGWYNSPMYKNIIANQAKSLYPDNEKKQTKFINKWNEVPNDKYWDTYADPKVKDFDEGAFGFSIPEGNIFLKDSFVKNNPTLANSLFAHEIKHKLPYTSFDENHILELTPKFDANIHKPGGNFDDQGVWHDATPAYDAYDNYLDKTDPDEVRTEIHAVRQLAKQAGIYDPYTEPFTKEHIDKLEKLYQEGGPDGKNFNQIGRLRKYYSDDQVIDMMNTISQNKGQSRDNMQMAALGSFVGEEPNPRLSGTQYDRFPKSNPGFGFNGPGSFSYYMDRLKNRKVHYANPHQGVKDAPVNMHTITGSCESGTCYEFGEGGLVDAYQLMGMPTPKMFGPGGSTDSLFSMTYGNPNRYYETKQEGDKYFVQQKGEFPLSNQQFKNWSSPSSTFSSPNQLNEWRSIGVNEYNKLNSQAVDGRIGYQRFAQGGHINHYIPSYNFGHVQSANNTYRHGFANGGPVGMYNFGSTIKDIGAGAYGVGEGFLDTVTMGATDQLTDAGYTGLQKLGKSSAKEIQQQNSIHGYSQAAGAVGGGFANPAALSSAITEGSQGLGQGISQGSPNSKTAQQVGAAITGLGSIAGMATGMGAFGNVGGAAQSANFQSTSLGNLATKLNTPGSSMQMTNMLANMGINSLSNYHAMGGAVNAPNMLKYADGGMAPPIDEAMAGAPQDNGPTQINVEKGELLVNKDGKILTEYRANNMVPHPADGSMDPRGTVPAQEGQFVITKRLAPDYKAAMTNNDKLYADAMRNNISFDKQRKEAKQQAQQQAQQEMMQDMMIANEPMMAKYGGMIRKYDWGNTVTPPPIDDSMAGSPAYQAETGNIAGFENMSATERMMAQNYPYKGFKGSGNNSNNNNNNNEFNPGYFAAQRALSYAAPLALGMEAAFTKPFTMNAADYQIKGRIDPYEEQYRPDYRPYNAALYSMNKIPGSGNLAARTNLYNAAEQSYFDQKYKVNQGNLSRKMAAQQANLGIEGQNLSTAMNIAQFNEQNKASRRNAIREQFGKNLPAVAYNDMANQMAMAGMSAEYPTYPFPWNKKRGV